MSAPAPDCFCCGSQTALLVVEVVVAGGVHEGLCLDCADWAPVLRWFAGEMESRYWRDRWYVRLSPGSATRQLLAVFRDYLPASPRRCPVSGSPPAVACLPGVYGHH